MIGGTDIICSVSPETPAVDVILRTVRRYWPHSVFQNADDPTPFVPDNGQWPPHTPSREFFIFRDEQAARSWDELGADPENVNTMLHVLLPGTEGKAPPSLTLVCDHLEGEMGAIVRDIQAGLTDQGRPG
jgi:hypothetical protein